MARSVTSKPGWLRTLARAATSATLGFAVVATCSGCSDGSSRGDPIPDESNERATITNDDEALAARVRLFDEEVPIDSGESAGMPPEETSMPPDERLAGRSTPAAARAAPRRVRLRLYAELYPPRVAGEVVQATSLSLDGGDKAMVSYNMRGAPRLGAVDWLTDLGTLFPRLRSYVTFNDSDINAVATDGAYVYTAAATEASELPFPAVLERIALKNDRLTLRDNKRIALTSFAGTGVMRTSDAIYVTSGDGGEVVALEKSNLDRLGSYPLDDARWAVWDEDGGQVLVVQGTPGRISVFAEGEFPNGSMELLDTFPFPGADVPESKSTADVAGDKLYIAAGAEGVQIMCLEDGRILGSVPRPDPARLGLDPSVVVTNAVSVEKDLMFISNGEAGVYVAVGGEDFKDTGCDPPDVTMIGRLRFDDLESVNHVEHENDYLFVAAGLGGVKIVRVLQ